MKEKSLELMSNSSHCVVSTLGPNGNPQSALVGFSEDEDLGLVIGTYKDSRKLQNIIKNPQVAIVISDEEKKLEIQYEGRASAVTISELGPRLVKHFQKLPAAKKRLNDPNQAWIKVVPIWVRFVDANRSPIKYEEMSFA